MTRISPLKRFLIASAGCCLLAACASTQSVLELHGTIMYEKPVIREVSYTLADSREEGGSAVVKVVLLGDPALSASFDITPGITERRPMKETASGRYEGEFSFPADLAGGPYTVVGRLHHEAAGEITRPDPTPLTIPLLEP